MDKKEIREKLKNSLDAVHIRSMVLVTLLIFAIYVTIYSLARGYWTVFLVVGLLVMLPFWVWYGWRYYQIFREPGSYVLCRTTLSQPHANWIRGSFRFTVVLETPESGRFVTSTEPIFQSHGLIGPLLEDYVNQQVTIAYNEDTAQVVVIG